MRFVYQHLLSGGEFRYRGNLEFIAFCLSTRSATVVGTGRISVLQVYVLLSRVLKLDKQTLVHRVNQLTWTLPLRAPAETVEYASRTVEDGGRERL